MYGSDVEIFFYQTEYNKSNTGIKLQQIVIHRLWYTDCGTLFKLSHCLLLLPSLPFTDKTSLISGAAHNRLNPTAAMCSSFPDRL